MHPWVWREMVNQTPLSLDLNRMTPKAFNIQQPGVDGFYLHLRLNPHHCYIKKKKKEQLIPLSQLSPVHPSMHLQVPLTHLPLPEH